MDFALKELERNLDLSVRIFNNLETQARDYRVFQIHKMAICISHTRMHNTEHAQMKFPSFSAKLRALQKSKDSCEKKTHPSL